MLYDRKVTRRGNALSIQIPSNIKKKITTKKITISGLFSEKVLIYSSSVKKWKYYHFRVPGDLGIEKGDVIKLSFNEETKVLKLTKV